MLITAITSQKRRKDRVNIFLDGKFAFSLSLDLLVKYGLKIDQQLSEAELNKIIKENELDLWMGRTLNFLSFRPRSKKEITDYLIKKEVGEKTIEILMQKLKDLKLVNDLDFIKWFIDQRMRFKPKSQRLLKYELMQKGINKQEIEQYFSSIEDESDEKEIAIKLVSIKYAHIQQLDKHKQKLKIASFLQRRGYNWDIINTVFKHFSI